jgi:hypothetical protein
MGINTSGGLVLPQITSGSTAYALMVDATKTVMASITTAQELSYLSGVTSNIQAQINALGSGISGLTPGTYVKALTSTTIISSSLLSDNGTTLTVASGGNTYFAVAVSSSAPNVTIGSVNGLTSVAIYGLTTVTGSIIPGANNSYSLGSSGVTWANGYFQNISAASGVTIGGLGLSSNLITFNSLSSTKNWTLSGASTSNGSLAVNMYNNGTLVGAALTFTNTAGIAGLTTGGQMISGGAIVPGVDLSYSLGASGARWASIMTGAINTTTAAQIATVDTTTSIAGQFNALTNSGGLTSGSYVVAAGTSSMRTSTILSESGSNLSVSGSILPIGTYSLGSSTSPFSAIYASKIYGTLSNTVITPAVDGTALTVTNAAGNTNILTVTTGSGTSVASVALGAPETISGPSWLGNVYTSPAASGAAEYYLSTLYGSRLFLSDVNRASGAVKLGVYTAVVSPAQKLLYSFTNTNITVGLPYIGIDSLNDFCWWILPTSVTAQTIIVIFNGISGATPTVSVSATAVSGLALQTANNGIIPGLQVICPDTGAGSSYFWAVNTSGSLVGVQNTLSGILTQSGGLLSGSIIGICTSYTFPAQIAILTSDGAVTLMSRTGILGTSLNVIGGSTPAGIAAGSGLGITVGYVFVWDTLGNITTMNTNGGALAFNTTYTWQFGTISGLYPNNIYLAYNSNVTYMFIYTGTSMYIYSVSAAPGISGQFIFSFAYKLVPGVSGSTSWISSFSAIAAPVQYTTTGGLISMISAPAAQNSYGILSIAGNDTLFTTASEIINSRQIYGIDSGNASNTSIIISPISEEKIQLYNTSAQKIFSISSATNNSTGTSSLNFSAYLAGTALGTTGMTLTTNNTTGALTLTIPSLNSGIIPALTGTYGIGSSGAIWLSSWITTMNAGTISGIGGTLTVVGNVLTTGGYNLGSSGATWQNGYFSALNVSTITSLGSSLTLNGGGTLGLFGGISSNPSINIFSIGNSAAPQTVGIWGNVGMNGYNLSGAANVSSTAITTNSITSLGNTLTVAGGGTLILGGGASSGQISIVGDANSGTGGSLQISGGSSSTSSANIITIGSSLAGQTVKIYGQIGMYGSILPGADNLYSLGVSGATWTNIWTHVVQVNTLNPASGATITVAANLVPSGTDTLGTSVSPWQSGYINTLNVSNINNTGTLSITGGTGLSLSGGSGGTGTITIGASNAIQTITVYGGVVSGNGATLGTSLARWGTLYAGGVNLLSLITPGNVVLVSDGGGNIISSGVTSTTLSYLDATSSIQTQLNGKQAALGGFTAGAIIKATSSSSIGNSSFISENTTNVSINGAGLSINTGASSTALSSALSTTGDVMMSINTGTSLATSTMSVKIPMTISANILPGANNTWAIGSASGAWATIYTYTINANTITALNGGVLKIIATNAGVGGSTSIVGGNDGSIAANNIVNIVGTSDTVGVCGGVINVTGGYSGGSVVNIIGNNGVGGGVGTVSIIGGSSITVAQNIVNIGSTLLSQTMNVYGAMNMTGTIIINGSFLPYSNSVSIGSSGSSFGFVYSTGVATNTITALSGSSSLSINGPGITTISGNPTLNLFGSVGAGIGGTIVVSGGTSTTASLNIVNIGSSTTASQTVGVYGSILPGANNLYTLGAAGMTWAGLWAVGATLTNLIVGGVVNSALTPGTSGIYGLGSSSASWLSGYIGTVVTGVITPISGGTGVTLNGNLIPGGTGNTLGSSGSSWQTGYFGAIQTNSIVIGGNITGNLTPSVTGTYVLGTSSLSWSASYIMLGYFGTISTISPATGINVIGNIIPNTTGSYGIGSSGASWLNGYITTMNVSVINPIGGGGGGGSSGTINVGGNLIQSTTTTSYTIGSSGTPWAAVYATGVVTGTLTAAGGTLSVVGNLVSSTTNAYSLGSAGVLWANVYATTIIAGIYTGAGGNLVFNGNLNPNAASTYTIGTANKTWADVYTDNIITSSFYPASGSNNSIVIYGSILPGVDGTEALGDPSAYWSAVYSGVIGTGSIIPLSGVSTYVGAGGNIVPTTSGSYTLGAAGTGLWSNLYSSVVTIGSISAISGGGAGTGTVTVSANIAPSGLYSLGSTGNIWVNGYISNVYTGFISPYGAGTSISIAGHLIPTNNNLYTLGVVGNVWATIYATNAVMTGLTVGTVTGTGASSSLTIVGNLVASSGIYSIGLTGSVWANAYITNIYLATMTPVGGVGSNVGVAGNVVPTVGGAYNLGSTGTTWLNLFVTSVNSNLINPLSGGNVSVSGNFLPASDNIYNLGATGTKWANIYAYSLNLTTINVTNAVVTNLTVTNVLSGLSVAGNIVPTVGGTYNLGSSGLYWSTLNAGVVYTNTINPLSGSGLTISAGSVNVTGGNASIAPITTNNITLTAGGGNGGSLVLIGGQNAAAGLNQVVIGAGMQPQTVTVYGSIYPAVDATYSLGSGSGAGWLSIYSGTVYTNFVTSGSNTLTLNGSVISSNVLGNVGSSGVPWNNVYASIIQTNTIIAQSGGGGGITISAGNTIVISGGNNSSSPLTSNVVIVSGASTSGTNGGTLSLFGGQSANPALNALTIGSSAIVQTVTIWGSLIVGSNNVYNLGSSGAVWAAGYITTIYSATINTGSVGSLSVVGNLVPSALNVYNLGSNALPWNYLYVSGITTGIVALSSVIPTGSAIGVGGNLVPTTSGTYTVGTAGVSWSALYAGGVYCTTLGPLSGAGVTVTVNANLLPGGTNNLGASVTPWTTGYITTLTGVTAILTNLNATSNGSMAVGGNLVPSGTYSFGSSGSAWNTGYITTLTSTVVTLGTLSAVSSNITVMGNLVASSGSYALGSVGTPWSVLYAGNIIGTVASIGTITVTAINASSSNITVNANLIPSTGNTLGTSLVPWTSQYSINIYCATITAIGVGLTLTGGNSASAPTTNNVATLTGGGSNGGSLTLAGGQSTTVGSNLLTIGASGQTQTIVVWGSIGAGSDSVYSLGSSGSYWSALYAKTVNVNAISAFGLNVTITGGLVPSGTGYTLGSTGVSWTAGYIGALVGTSATLSVLNATVSNITINGNLLAGAAGYVIGSSGTPWTTGYIGTIVTTTINPANSNIGVTIGGNLLAGAAGYVIGSSGTPWTTGYIGTIVTTTINPANSNIGVTIGGNLLAGAAGYVIGSTGTPWTTGYITNVIGTNITTGTITAVSGGVNLIGNLLPNTSASYTLGSLGVYWNAAYVGAMYTNSISPISGINVGATMTIVSGNSSSTPLTSNLMTISAGNGVGGTLTLFGGQSSTVASNALTIGASGQAQTVTVWGTIVAGGTGYNLGSSGTPWAAVYASGMNVATLTVGTINPSGSALNIGGNIVPFGSFSLGVNGTGWLAGYITTVYTNTLTSLSGGALSISGAVGAVAGALTVVGGNSSTTPLSNNVVTVSGGGTNGGTLSLFGGQSSTVGFNALTIGASGQAQTVTVWGTIVAGSTGYNLGSSGTPWAVGYIGAIVCGTISAVGSNISITGNIVPSVNNSYNLGSSALGWAGIYGAALAINTISTFTALTTLAVSGASITLTAGNSSTISNNYVTLVGGGSNGGSLNLSGGQSSSAANNTVTIGASGQAQTVTVWGSIGASSNNLYNLGSSGVIWANIYSNSHAVNTIVAQNGSSLTISANAAGTGTLTVIGGNSSTTPLSSNVVSVSGGGTNGGTLTLFGGQSSTVGFNALTIGASGQAQTVTVWGTIVAGSTGYNLGSAGTPWVAVYTSAISTNSIVSGGILTVTGSIVGSSTGYNLGSTGTPWATEYSTTVYTNTLTSLSGGALSISGAVGAVAGTLTVVGGNSSTTPLSNNVITVSGGGTNGGTLSLFGGQSTTVGLNALTIGSSTQGQIVTVWGTIAAGGSGYNLGSGGTPWTVGYFGTVNSSTVVSGGILTVTGSIVGSSTGYNLGSTGTPWATEYSTTVYTNTLTSLSGGALSISGAVGAASGALTVVGGNSSTTPLSNNVITVSGGGTNGGTLSLFGGQSTTVGLNALTIGASGQAQTVTVWGSVISAGSGGVYSIGSSGSYWLSGYFTTTYTNTITPSSSLTVGGAIIASLSNNYALGTMSIPWSAGYMTTGYVNTINSLNSGSIIITASSGSVAGTVTIIGGNSTTNTSNTVTIGAGGGNGGVLTLNGGTSTTATNNVIVIGASGTGQSVTVWGTVVAGGSGYALGSSATPWTNIYATTVNTNTITPISGGQVNVGGSIVPTSTGFAIGTNSLYYTNIYSTTVNANSHISMGGAMTIYGSTGNVAGSITITGGNSSTPTSNSVTISGGTSAGGSLTIYGGTNATVTNNIVNVGTSTGIQTINIYGKVVCNGNNTSGGTGYPTADPITKYQITKTGTITAGTALSVANLPSGQTTSQVRGIYVIVYGSSTGVIMPNSPTYGSQYSVTITTGGVITLTPGGLFTSGTYSIYIYLDMAV